MLTRRKSRPSPAALGLCALLSACSVESDPPNGARAGSNSGASGASGSPFIPGPPASSALSVVGDPALRLGLGEPVDLVVRLTSSDGDPERDQAVSFNLVGRAEDASLSALVDSTNREGIASVTLRAATRPVTFEVRASAGRTRAVTFTVSVSGNGFGTLHVSAPYEGPRKVVERFVLALPNAACPAEQRDTDPRTVLAPGENRASLIALPAAVPYAVLALGQSASGEILARGCVDERCNASGVCEPLTVRAQAEDSVVVPFEDLPLTPEAGLELEITLQAGSAAAALGSAIRSAANTELRTSPTGQTSLINAEGRFWLDTLDVVLRAGSGAEIELAEALAEARLAATSDGPEPALSRLLQVNGEGAGLAASALAGYVRSALDRLVLHGEVGYAAGAEPEIAVRLARIEARPVKEGGSTPTITLGRSSVRALEAALRPDDDALEITKLELTPRLGALAIKALERALAPTAQGHGEALTALAGCGSLAEWLEKQTLIDAAACAGPCIERACEHSLARLFEASVTALELVDEQRPTATLAGALALTDDDGNLRAERMEAEQIDGLWAPAANASLGDTLRGTASAR